jgi:hypothetical protein
MRKNEVGLQRDKFLRESLHQRRVGRRRAPDVDADVAALRPPERLQPLAERREAGLSSGVVLAQPHQHPDPPDLTRLLRLSGDRTSLARTRLQTLDVLRAPSTSTGP